MFDDPKFLSKLESLEKRYGELTDLLGQPEVISNRAQFMKLSKEQKHLGNLTEAIGTRRRVAAELTDAKAMLRDNDPDVREMAKEEVPRLEKELEEVEQRIKVLLLPP